MEDFCFTHSANGDSSCGPFERAQGGGREERRPDGSGKGAIGCVEAHVNSGHRHSCGDLFTSSPTPHGKLVGYAGSKALIPLASSNNVAGAPAKNFDDGDMVMVANLLAHPESVLKVSGALVAPR